MCKGLNGPVLNDVESRRKILLSFLLCYPKILSDMSYWHCPVFLFYCFFAKLRVVANLQYGFRIWGRNKYITCRTAFPVEIL